MIFNSIILFFSFVNFNNICNVKNSAHNSINVNRINNIVSKITPEYISDGSHKKIIKMRTFLNYRESFNTINNFNISLKDSIRYKNYNDYIIFKNDLADNYLNRRSFRNEFKFIKNNNTKVYLHIEELFNDVNIYHVGITFKSLFKRVRYDLVGVRLYETGFMRNNNRRKKTIFWDYSSKTIDDIIKYEKSLKYRYILGIYDCRHHVRNLTTWASSNPSPVWRLHELMK